MNVRHSMMCKSNILLNRLCNSYRYALFSKFSSPTSEDEHVANHRLEPLDEVDPTAQSITNKVSLTTFILARKIWRTFCKNGEEWNGIWQQKSILTLGCYKSLTS